MKKTLYFIAGVIVLVIAGYYFLRVDKSEISRDYTTYSNSELGIQFDYRAGPNGYVLEERILSQTENLIKVITLISTEDAGRIPPEGGEGPAVIAISVFNNNKKQFPEIWANENIQYSNINLKFGDVMEDVVGGANAIRYMADGLYASENVVVTHGENIYVITGQFMTEDSQIRRDFSPLIESIDFIPKPNQQ